MPPLGKCLRRIALAAAMVNEFIETTPNTNKTQLLAMLLGKIESATTTNAGESPAISIAMQMRWYDAGCIAR